jgi:hypothetical protein
MPRIDLHVPFHEKDEAKAYGARWDPQRRIWYVPGNVDSSKLRKWVPGSMSGNIRAESYFLADATCACWHCSSRARVFGIILPAGHKVLYVDDDPADDHWEMVDQPTMMSYITFLADPVPAQLSKLSPLYRADCSQTTQRFYWMNHCDHCGARLGDFDTVEECGAALNPVTIEDAVKVRLRERFEPLLGACGAYTCGVNLFEYMRRSV